jgi:hypothetical protein
MWFRRPVGCPRSHDHRHHHHRPGPHDPGQSARTAKHPDFLDLCIALTGRAPLAGVYLDGPRRARRVLDIDLPAGIDDGFWPLIGYLAGKAAPDAIPLMRGLARDAPTRDDLKALCAAFGTTSAAPMLHVEGVTPEAGLADKIEGAVIPVDKPDMLALTFREPVGVVAAITAWNAPLQFLAVKCAPALAAGCAVVFGPILSIIGFDDEAEAIRIANDTPYGLAAGMWTKDLGRLIRLCKAVDAGTVWGNTYRTYSVMVPFGGRKRSGLGKEWGREGIEAFLDTKSVMISTADIAPSLIPRQVRRAGRRRTRSPSAGLG